MNFMSKDLKEDKKQYPVASNRHSATGKPLPINTNTLKRKSYRNPLKYFQNLLTAPKNKFLYILSLYVLPRLPSFLQTVAIGTGKQVAEPPLG